jgi:hypothetical protein
MVQIQLYRFAVICHVQTPSTTSSRPSSFWSFQYVKLHTRVSLRQLIRPLVSACKKASGSWLFLTDFMYSGPRVCSICNVAWKCLSSLKFSARPWETVLKFSAGGNWIVRIVLICAVNWMFVCIELSRIMWGLVFFFCLLLHFVS